MSLKKRGLGRGLEVLLAESPALEGRQEAPTASVSDDERALIELIQQERINLLQEAEALKVLMDELESMIRTELR
jgi:hypothetical protein